MIVGRKNAIEYLSHIIVSIWNGSEAQEYSRWERAAHEKQTIRPELEITGIRQSLLNRQCIELRVTTVLINSTFDESGLFWSKEGVAVRATGSRYIA